MNCGRLRFAPPRHHRKGGATFQRKRFERFRSLLLHPCPRLAGFPCRYGYAPGSDRLKPGFEFELRCFGRRFSGNVFCLIEGFYSDTQRTHRKWSGKAFDVAVGAAPSPRYLSVNLQRDLEYRGGGAAPTFYVKCQQPVRAGTQPGSEPTLAFIKFPDQFKQRNGSSVDMREKGSFIDESMPAE